MVFDNISLETFDKEVFYYFLCFFGILIIRRTLILGASIGIYITLLATLWPSTSGLNSTWKCINRMPNPTTGRMTKYLYQRLPDHVNVDGVLPNDLFFDRLVYIHHEGRYDRTLNNTDTKDNVTVADLSVTLNGAIISENLVLTSWNPFRNIIRFQFKRFFTHVCVTWKRRYGDMSINRVQYHLIEYDIDCARPVIPLRDEDIPIDLWHGYLNDPKMHSPIHDLVVFRVSRPFHELSKVQLAKSTDEWLSNPTTFNVVGPVQSFLANETDTLGRNFKFAMLGDNLSKVMLIRRNVYVREYQPEENALTDCDEWIPREWGWFICLRNLDNIPRLASGAMLYHNDLLYGVGSFALWKGKESILVFTDVRKYKDLILNTCTAEDKQFPHT